jgi:coniferyl-aldehyde dehydrogenase|tara:strand:- start:3940 stop:4170 length:231 start_codon:yes stop_codon:yes gene_type:complete
LPASAILTITNGDWTLPFGGYVDRVISSQHGQGDFLTFSKLRPVFKQSRWRLLDILMSPYGGNADRQLNFMAKMKF